MAAFPAPTKRKQRRHRPRSVEIVIEPLGDLALESLGQLDEFRASAPPPVSSSLR